MATIAELKKENERLRQALKNIIEGNIPKAAMAAIGRNGKNEWGLAFGNLQDIARAALKTGK